MFERINKKVKGFFSSQRMKTLALMLLVGTTAAMAQNATTRQERPRLPQ